MHASAYERFVPIDYMLHRMSTALVNIRGHAFLHMLLDGGWTANDIEVGPVCMLHVAQSLQGCIASCFFFLSSLSLPFFCLKTIGMLQLVQAFTPKVARTTQDTACCCTYQ
jgi:hypothetical protein